jgi:hypothetical protein
MRGLANPDLKVRRAKLHLDALEMECRRFVESKPYSVTAYDDAKSAEYVVEVQFSTPDIWPMGAIAGDFISCLRASLDHLIHGLVRLGTVEPTINTGFPIIGIYNGEKSENRFKNAVRGIPDEAITIVRNLQPYNSGKSYKETFLWRLDTLWNIDKHRHIPLDAGACDIEFPNVPRAMRPAKAGIVNDRAVVRFPIVAKPYVNSDPVSRVYMRFGSEKDEVLLDIEDCKKLYDYVTEKVISRFASFYK